VRTFCRNLLYAQPSRYGPPPSRPNEGTGPPSRSHLKRRGSTHGSSGGGSRAGGRRGSAVVSAPDAAALALALAPSSAGAGAVPNFDLRGATGGGH
jgi:hypothetical protein